MRTRQDLWSGLRAGRPALVLARAGDPLMKEGRARLIWAANIADALGELGYRVHLAGTGGYSWNPLFWRARLEREPPSPALKRFYAVEGRFHATEFRLPAFLKARGARFLESGDYQLRHFLTPRVLGRFGLIHTRDWRVVENAVSAGVPTLYEDHHESFNIEQRSYPASIVHRTAFIGAVAISDYVAEGMLAKGLPAAKLVVENSGMNPRSLEPPTPERIRDWQQRLTGDRSAQSIVGYAGGLHEIRGIRLLLEAAARLPEVHFAVAGGRGRQAKAWREEARHRELSNVQFLGYLPQTELPAFLRAVDLLALPYLSAETAPITSPLKFFEYLAAARPIVACHLPAMTRFSSLPGTDLSWSPVGDTKAFTALLKARLAAGPISPEAAARHLELAANHTWRARQQRLHDAFEIPQKPPALATA